MSCYLRHLRPVFEEAGLEEPNDKRARKALDLRIRELVGVQAEARCSLVWPTIKEHLADPTRRASVIAGLRRDTGKA